jgi:hypothetical protein
MITLTGSIYEHILKIIFVAVILRKSSLIRKGRYEMSLVCVKLIFFTTDLNLKLTLKNFSTSLMDK